MSFILCICKIPATKQNPDDHIRKHHKKVKEFKCELCSKEYFAKGGLLAHMKHFHKENEFICNLCSITFSRKWSLKNHTSTIHENLKAFKCNLCDKQFTTKASL